jgi:hypothetical protein
MKKAKSSLMHLWINGSGEFEMTNNKIDFRDFSACVDHFGIALAIKMMLVLGVPREQLNEWAAASQSQQEI